jgi:hypothetical protein
MVELQRKMELASGSAEKNPGKTLTKEDPKLTPSWLEPALRSLMIQN